MDRPFPAYKGDDPYVFVCYAHDDEGVVYPEIAWLHAEGANIWYDEGISLGEEWSEELGQAINGAEKFLFFLTPRSVSSRHCRNEVNFAQAHDVAILSVHLEETQLPAGLELLIGSNQAIIKSKRDLASYQTTLRTAILQPKSPGSITSNSGEANCQSRAPKPLRKSWSTVAALVSVAGLVGIFVFLSDSRHNFVEPGDMSIVVRAFSALPDDGQTQHFADSLQDTIERVLATNHIRIVRKPNELTQQSVHAEFAVEGTVERGTDTISINADLLHQGENRILWSTLMERKVGQSQSLRQRMAISIADVLRCAFRLRARANNDRSTELLSRFLRYCQAERSNGSEWEQMPVLSRRLVEAAPQHAITHAVHALSHAFMIEVDAGDRTRQEIGRLSEVALASADKALTIDPSIGEIYWVQAMNPAQSLATQERLLQQSLEVDPDFLYSRSGLANLLLKVGRVQEARGYLNRFVNDYPLELGRRAVVARLTAELGEVESARQQLREAETLLADEPVLIFSRLNVELWYGDPKVAAKLLSIINVETPIKNCIDPLLNARRNDKSLNEETILRNCAADVGATQPGFELLINTLAYFGHVDAVYREILSNVAALSKNNSILWRPYMSAVWADPRFMRLTAKLGLVEYWLESDKWPDFCTTKSLPYDCKAAALTESSSSTPDSA